MKFHMSAFGKALGKPDVYADLPLKDGEGNGNPLQYSCLENPRDGEPDGLLSMGSHKVRHDWSNLAAAAATQSKDTYRIWIG